MEATLAADTVAYPGGYDAFELIAAVHLAAQRHFAEVPTGELEHAIVTRFLQGLVARHPEGLPSDDPYYVRVLELAGERASLLNSHLKLSWFRLAYWSYGLIAALSGLSATDDDSMEIFVRPIVVSLAELGIDVSRQECLHEFERFLPLRPSPRSLSAAAHLFCSYARFLHRAALRRRRVVTPDLALPAVAAVASADMDAQEAHHMTRFLTSHGVSLVAGRGDAP